MKSNQKLVLGKAGGRWLLTGKSYAGPVEERRQKLWIALAIAIGIVALYCAGHSDYSVLSGVAWH